MRSILTFILFCFFVHHFRLFAQEPIYIGGHGNDVTCVAFSPNNEYIVSGSWDGIVNIYINDSIPVYFMSLEDHKGPINSLGFSRDSKKLITGGQDGQTITYHFDLSEDWDYVGVDTIFNFSGRPVSKVAFGPSMRMIFSADETGVLNVYDLVKRINRSVKTGSPINTFAISVDQMAYFVANKGKTEIVQYDILGKEIRKFAGHQAEINDLEVTVDRKYLISGSTDKSIKVWNLATGKEERSFGNHTWNVTALSVDPYSTYVASCGLDGKANIYQIEDGKLIKSMNNSLGRCVDISFSSDLKKIVVGLQLKTKHEKGYGSNVWYTGLSKPIPKDMMPTGARSKAVQEALRKAQGGGSKNHNSSSQKQSTQQSSENKKPERVINKTEQLEIRIEE